MATQKKKPVFKPSKPKTPQEKKLEKQRGPNGPKTPQEKKLEKQRGVPPGGD